MVSGLATLNVKESAKSRRVIALQKKLLSNRVEEAMLVEEGLPCGRKLPDDAVGSSYAFFYNHDMKKENNKTYR